MKTIFRRINGRVIPIGRASAAASAGAGTAVAGATYAASRSAKEKIEPSRTLQIGASAAAVASGVLSAATFFSKGRTFWAGQGLSTALDVASSVANATSVAGRGHTKARVKAGAQGELINQALGYAAFAGTLASTKMGRQKSVEFAVKGLGYLQQGFGIARKIIL